MRCKTISITSESNELKNIFKWVIKNMKVQVKNMSNISQQIVFSPSYFDS
jgi:hypothetical protein